jgi:hypothetical protein
VLVVGEDWGGNVAPIVAAIGLILAGVVALERAPQVAGVLGAGAGEPAK